MEAYQIIMKYNSIDKHSEEEDFLYTEALQYLIETEDNPRAMMELGGYYYEQKKFDLAKEYYEMAADKHFPDAYSGLGYIYYYGRCGEPDYEKAFKYYSLAAEFSNEALLKVADMYKTVMRLKKM